MFFFLYGDKCLLYAKVRRHDRVLSRPVHNRLPSLPAYTPMTAADGVFTTERAQASSSSPRRNGNVYTKIKIVRTRRHRRWASRTRRLSILAPVSTRFVSAYLTRILTSPGPRQFKPVSLNYFTIVRLTFFRHSEYKYSIYYFRRRCNQS